MKRLYRSLLLAICVATIFAPSVFASNYTKTVVTTETPDEAATYVDKLIKEETKNDPDIKVTGYFIGLPIITTSNPVVTKNINQRLNQLAQNSFDFIKKPQLNTYVLNGYVQYANKKYISVVATEFYSFTGAAHGLENVYGIVFDEKTGQEIPRSYFLPIHSMNDIYEGLTTGHLQLKTMNGRLLTYDSFFKANTLSNSYYIDENNHIFLIFQQYELAPYSDGTTVIEFSPKQILNYRTTGKF